MRPSVPLGLLPFLSQTFALSVPYRDAEQERANDHAVRNANHIFNAIHSSMRQWGSSWNHNGMSYFLATVPEDTEFYNGGHTADPVTGLNWLAFEPEHSLWFAGMGPPGPPPEQPHQEYLAGQTERQPGPHHPHDSTMNKPRDAQAPIHLDEDDPQRPHDPPPDGPRFGHSGPGHLHIYRTKHPLSLLYIDGMSAAKSSMETLDSQDFGLLNRISKQDGRPNAPQDEQARAQEMCAVAKDRWNDKIDGFIRMEIGFEIILCDFEKHLDEIDTLTTEDSKDELSNRPEYNQQFEWYRAIAARFHGIGYNRVTDLAPLHSALDTLILSHAPTPQTPPPTDWQSTSDLITTRYSTAIPYLANITDSSTLQAEIQLLMRPFVDFSARNLTARNGSVHATFPSHDVKPSVLTCQRPKWQSPPCRVVSATLSSQLSTFHPSPTPP